MNDTYALARLKLTSALQRIKLSELQLNQAMVDMCHLSGALELCVSLENITHRIHVLKTQITQTIENRDPITVVEPVKPKCKCSDCLGSDTACEMNCADIYPGKEDWCAGCTEAADNKDSEFDADQAHGRF